MRSIATFWVEQPDADASQAPEIRRQQIETLNKRLPVVVAGNLANSALTAAIVWNHTTPQMLIPWFALIWASSLVRMWLWQRRNAAKMDDAANRRALKFAVAMSLLSSFLWGFAAIAFFANGQTLQDVFVVFVVGGMAAAAASYLAILPLACLAFIAFSMGPLVIELAAAGEPVLAIMAAILVIYSGALVILARNSYADFIARVCTAQDNAGLVDRLERTSQELERRVYERTAELQASERRTSAAHRRLRDAIEAMPDGVVLFDADDRLIMCNEQYRRMLPECSAIMVPGARLDQIHRTTAESGAVVNAAGRVEEWIADARRRYQNPGAAFVESYSGDRWIRVEERRTAEGGTVSVRSDITHSMQQEAAVRASEEQLRLVTDSLPVLIAYIDADRRFRFLNKTFEEWHKCHRSEAIGRPMKTVVLPAQYESLQGSIAEALSGKIVSGESSMIFNDGIRRQIQRLYIPHIDDNGKVLGYFALVEDITAQRETEAKLRQAQKTEAIGQLTGGIAHDFNNLLGIIIGNLELIEDRVAGDPRTLRLIRGTNRACLRGAELTNRLLAFARRQALEPRVTDVNDLTKGLIELLGRTLEESIHIETSLADELWPAMVDPGQLENAVLNIALNARDAMGDGGRLKIETFNVGIDDCHARQSSDLAPGRYVAISLTDTGCGMPSEIAARAFDPFFTTKDIGEGSGLGLSMVYGFVKQSGGHATIQSAQGHGTTVQIFLPVAENADPTAPASDGAELNHATGAEKILLVEDNAELREMAMDTLRSLGYSVLAACDGPSALAILENEHDIDMLFTDVVMPGGMNGRALAAQALASRPDLRVLFTSGYTSNAIMRSGGLERGVHLIEKPYRKHELAQMVRTVLDQATG